MPWKTRLVCNLYVPCTCPILSWATRPLLYTLGTESLRKQGAVPWTRPPESGLVRLWHFSPCLAELERLSVRFDSHTCVVSLPGPRFTRGERWNRRITATQAADRPKSSQTFSTLFASKATLPDPPPALLVEGGRGNRCHGREPCTAMYSGWLDLFRQPLVRLASWASLDHVHIHLPERLEAQTPPSSHSLNKREVVSFLYTTTTT